MSELPKKYDHQSCEKKWQQSWEESQVYAWDESKGRDETFVVDTPPPTVSGSLHVGHVFSYTHTDIIVRYQRMTGKNIMYPMGWDDNGLPTERRVQNKFHINCNPHLPFDPNWTTDQGGKEKEPKEISRQNFINACGEVTSEDESAFETLWRHLALSVDWKQQYATIDDHCRATSQFSFLDLVEKGLIYNVEAPTMWDVTFQTALAQADIEDRNTSGAYHDIEFGIEGGGNFVISTTRPELLAACIAVVAHPDDERYKKYFGKNAITPLFHVKVPIVPSDHADPEKGTGIMMVCTFGDAADVDWWKKSGLPIRQIIGKNGCLQPIDFSAEPFLSEKSELAATFYAELVGKGAKQARKKIAELLAQANSSVDGKSSALQGEPKVIEHPVKFYEKGDRPIEFVTTRQWFVKILPYKKELLAQGAKINWHPAHMRTRYDHWVEGLNQDWCISRQRFFGVPFPVWYPISSTGVVDYQNPIFAKGDKLPIDPLSEVPPGYKEEQRGQPSGFCGDPDVMDTWATSSLTPQIASHWLDNKETHKKLFPMDVRPQSHEIIRTWAFYTIVKAWMHEKEIPWKNVVISGWILDPDRKKMSKSKGNVVTPQHLLEQYSSDAIRYWAGRARLGVDTAFDEKVFKSGQKLCTKIFNASKFALMQIHEVQDELGEENASYITEALDRSFVSYMRNVIKTVSASFDRFDYAVALTTIENAFWFYCDNYIELVKGRAYQHDNPQARLSAVACLEWSLGVFLRLFAPFLPYISEEVWFWHFEKYSKKGSVHKSKWPSLKEVECVKDDIGDDAVRFAVEVLDAIRQKKSEQQKSLKTEVSQLSVTGSSDNIQMVCQVSADIERAGRVVPGGTSYRDGSAPEGGNFNVEVELEQE